MSVIREGLGPPGLSGRSKIVRSQNRVVLRHTLRPSHYKGFPGSQVIDCFLEWCDGGVVDEKASADCVTTTGHVAAVIGCGP